MKTKKLPAVKSLSELRLLAKTDERYAKLLCIASSNLGGPDAGLESCYRWLSDNAAETSESDVVGEVNFCRDLVQS